MLRARRGRLGVWFRSRCYGLVQRVLGHASSKIAVVPNKDVGAAIASGSYTVDSMAVIPCSVGTLAKISAGTCDDLLARAADVMLKEGRKLVLCIRDTPFGRIHLENMLRAEQAGAVIMPAIPSYYHAPQTIDDLVTQYVCRVLAQMDLPQEAMFRWTGSAAASCWRWSPIRKNQLPPQAISP